MDNFTGEIAALAAALAFSFTSTSFTLAGRKLGALVSLAFSLPISLIALVIVHWLTLGTPYPTTASLERWFDLGMSSVLGFVISSIMLLRAFQYIGPRLTLLISSLAPVLSALMAWIFLDQDLPTNAVFGIALVIAGILWVVSEGEQTKTDTVNSDFRLGMLLAIGGAIGQALSFIFMSRGVADDFHATSASVIRILVGVVALWLMLAMQGKLASTLRLLRTESTSMKHILIASLAGPALGSSLVLLSLQFTSVGISSTLTNTTPIMLIPIGYFVFRERITLRAISGTIVAIIGIAVLFT